MNLRTTTALASLSAVMFGAFGAPSFAQESDQQETGDVVVVTAQRREEALSDVPISITALNQEMMDQRGVKSIADVIRFTPGVRFDPADNGISIRGISSGAGAGTTGIYIDDTPIQMRALGFSADDSLPAIFDLERVEILRGPQGTLFGAGSQGGTVRYIMRQPSLLEYSVDARSEVSTTRYGAENYEAGAAVGGPLLEDKIGFRVSAWHRRDGGFVDKSDINGRILDENVDYGDVTVVRGSLAFEPTPQLRITPTLHYQRRTTNEEPVFATALSDRGDGVFKDSSPEYPPTNDRFYLSSLYATYDFEGMQFVSNTSYFHRNNRTGYDGTVYNLTYYQDLYLDYLDTIGDPNAVYYPFFLPEGPNPDLPPYVSPAPVTNTQRNFTQEVRLQSTNDSRLDWVVGVFYQKNRQVSIEELVEPEDDTLFPFLVGMSIEEFFGYPLYGQDSYINQTNAKESQLAGFVDLTYSLTDQLKINVGGRYARAEYSFTNFADGSQNVGRTGGAGESSETPFTPKAGLSFQADPDNLFYLTWSKGFRVGGANAPVPVNICGESLDFYGIAGATDSYESDEVASWEIGSKNNLFDGRLQIAASAYHVDWTNIQQSVYLFDCGIQFTDNLGNARSQGFDLEFTASPYESLQLNASVGFTEAKYTTTTQLGQGSPIVSEGDSLGAPKWTVSLGAMQRFPLFGREGYLRADYQYDSGASGGTPGQDVAFFLRGPTHFVSARAGVHLTDSLDLSVFADNLLDATPLLDRSRTNSSLYVLDRTFRPRTIGLTLTYGL